MTTLGKRRLRTTDAERLLNGEPAGAEHAQLAALLSAAAAPGLARELADEPAMVAAFVRAYEDPPPRRARARRPGRFPVVKVATGVVLFATVGTAVAAETGNLPLRRHAHGLFSSVGAPTPGNDATAAARARTAPSTPGAPVASPAPPPATPGEPAVVGLCRAWATSRRDPHGSAMAPERLRALIAAAGNARDIPAFCAGKVDGVPPTIGPPSGSVPSTAEHRPDAGKGGDPPGKDKGPSGNGGGRGPRSGTLR